MTSLAAPPCDRVAPPTGLPACQWRGRPSSSPRPATPISIGRSTRRRSSCIRSKWVGCCAAMASQTRSSPPGSCTTCLKRPRPLKAQLQRRFGAAIARLVESVSDDPSIINDEARKHELRDRVAHAGSEPLVIFAADKISKVRELALLPVWQLDEPKTRAKLAQYEATSRCSNELRESTPSSIFSTPSSTSSGHRNSKHQERARKQEARRAASNHHNMNDPCPGCVIELAPEEGLELLRPRSFRWQLCTYVSPAPNRTASADPQSMNRRLDRTQRARHRVNPSANNNLDDTSSLLQTAEAALWARLLLSARSGSDRLV
jgi:hypothetical protein